MTPRRETLTPTPETGFEPVNVRTWARVAQPGSSLTYWEGNLAEACERELLGEKMGATNKTDARFARRDAWDLYEKDKAVLYQRKLDDFVKAYIVELKR
jgi:hypothetical protein